MGVVGNYFLLLKNLPRLRHGPAVAVVRKIDNTCTIDDPPLDAREHKV